MLILPMILVKIKFLIYPGFSLEIYSSQPPLAGINLFSDIVAQKLQILVKKSYIL